MTSFRKFAQDQSGSTLSSISMTAGAITICCLSAAFVLDKVTTPAMQLPKMPVPTAQRTAGLGLNEVTVDYTPTASIPGNFTRGVTLDPCTGARK
jgi:hypothetical protein